MKSLIDRFIDLYAAGYSLRYIAQKLHRSVAEMVDLEQVVQDAAWEIETND